MYAVLQTATRQGGAKLRSRSIAVVGCAMILAATMPTAYAQIGEFGAAPSPVARFAFTGTYRFKLPKTVTTISAFRSRRPRASRIEPPTPAIVAIVVPVSAPPTKTRKFKPADNKAGPPRHAQPANGTSNLASTHVTTTASINPKLPKPHVQAKPISQRKAVATASKRAVAQAPLQWPPLSRRTRSALGASLPPGTKNVQNSETTARPHKPITIAKEPGRSTFRMPVKASDKVAVRAPHKSRIVVAATPSAPDTISLDKPKPSITRSAGTANLPPLPTAYQRPKQTLSAIGRSTRATSIARSRLGNRSSRKRRKASTAKKAVSNQGEPAWMREVLRN
jgi:hypothetical protein